MRTINSSAPPRPTPLQKKFEEKVVKKTTGTIYDPLWYFLFIFIFFFVFWLRTEIIKIRDAYWAVPGVTIYEMKSFSWLWISAVTIFATMVTLVLKLKFNHFRSRA
jgi:hypothetical protein